MVQKRLGIIMNGVTGRMGMNQHLVRSILEIRKQGGVALKDGTRAMPDPILVGRNAAKVEALAQKHGVERWTADLDKALQSKDEIFFDAASTQLRPSLLKKAIAAGKHVYCEKPLTHNIREARLVARVAKETGVATQMGNHGRSGEGHRQTVEWIKDGAIGAVSAVHAWSGNARTAKNPGPGQGPTAQPSGLNWDLWLGPRTARPFSGKYAPFVWRWVWDFGNGTMPDMAPHHFDPAFNALGLDAPVTMEARASDLDPVVTTGSHLITYQYAAQGNRGPLTLYWYDNGLRPPTPLGIDPDDPQQRLGEGDNGLMFVGEKGILTCAGWSGMPRLLPMVTAGSTYEVRASIVSGASRPSALKAGSKWWGDMSGMVPLPKSHTQRQTNGATLPV